MHTCLRSVLFSAKRAHCLLFQLPDKCDWPSDNFMRTHIIRLDRTSGESFCAHSSRQRLSVKIVDNGVMFVNRRVLFRYSCRSLQNWFIMLIHISTRYSMHTFNAFWTVTQMSLSNTDFNSIWNLHAGLQFFLIEFNENKNTVKPSEFSDFGANSVYNSFLIYRF